MLPVYAISLVRSLDRRDMLSKQMAHLGIEYQLFDAVDGRNLSDDDLKRVDLVKARACGIYSHDDFIGSPIYLWEKNLVC